MHNCMNVTNSTAIGVHPPLIYARICTATCIALRNRHINPNKHSMAQTSKAHERVAGLPEIGSLYFGLDASKPPTITNSYTSSGVYDGQLNEISVQFKFDFKRKATCNIICTVIQTG